MERATSASSRVIDIGSSLAVALTWGGQAAYHGPASAAIRSAGWEGIDELVLNDVAQQPCGAVAVRHCGIAGRPCAKPKALSQRRDPFRVRLSGRKWCRRAGALLCREDWQDLGCDDHHREPAGRHRQHRYRACGAVEA